MSLTRLLQVSGAIGLAALLSSPSLIKFGGADLLSLEDHSFEVCSDIDSNRNFDIAVDYPFEFSFEMFAGLREVLTPKEAQSYLDFLNTWDDFDYSSAPNSTEGYFHKLHHWAKWISVWHDYAMSGVELDAYFTAFTDWIQESPLHALEHFPDMYVFYRLELPPNIAVLYKDVVDPLDFRMIGELYQEVISPDAAGMALLTYSPVFLTSSGKMSPGLFVLLQNTVPYTFANAHLVRDEGRIEISDEELFLYSGVSLDEMSSRRDSLFHASAITTFYNLRLPPALTNEYHQDFWYSDVLYLIAERGMSPRQANRHISEVWEEGHDIVLR